MAASFRFKMSFYALAALMAGSLIHGMVRGNAGPHDWSLPAEEAP